MTEEELTKLGREVRFTSWVALGLSLINLFVIYIFAYIVFGSLK